MVWHPYLTDYIIWLLWPSPTRSTNIIDKVRIKIFNAFGNVLNKKENINAVVAAVSYDTPPPKSFPLKNNDCMTPLAETEDHFYEMQKPLRRSPQLLISTAVITSTHQCTLHIWQLESVRQDDSTAFIPAPALHSSHCCKAKTQLN